MSDVPSGLVAVVVTYNSSSEVADCLRSLARELDGEHDRVVVVDNASSDDTVRVARLASRSADVVENPTNAGFGTACNRGAARHPDHDVLLVNPDCQALPGSVGALRRALAGDPGRGLIGPRIDRFDGSPEPGCRRSFPDPATSFYRLTRMDRAFPRNARISAYNRLSEDPSVAAVIDAGSGAAMLIRRQAWNAIGGFDTGFFMYGEDLDLCKRLHDAGWVTWYEPASRFLHHKGASSRQRPYASEVHAHKSMWRYYTKHHLRGAEALLAPVVGLAIGARLGLRLTVAGTRRTMG